MSEENSPSSGNRTGPHDDRELELMLAGKKPLALFYDTVPECGVIPEREFAPHVDSGRVIKGERIFPSSEGSRTGSTPPVRVVFYALPEEVWRIDQAISLMEEGVFQKGRPHDEDNARLGRLLGYTEGEIKRHLASSHAQTH